MAGGGPYSFRRLDDTQWDDLRTAATAVNPPGAASDPDRESTSGLLLFNAGSTELVYIFQQMPHKWQYGTEIRPHVHWTKTTSAAGNVAWRLRYKRFDIAEVGDAAWTDIGIKTEVVAWTPDNNTASEHLITSFGDLEMVSQGLSDCLLFELSRVGGDASDTYGADARLLEFDVHYQINKLGSEDEFDNLGYN